MLLSRAHGYSVDRIVQCGNTGCTSKEARNRQEWCQEILEVEMYYAFSQEMEKELLQIAS